MKIAFCIACALFLVVLFRIGWGHLNLMIDRDWPEEKRRRDGVRLRVVR